MSPRPPRVSGAPIRSAWRSQPEDTLLQRAASGPIRPHRRSPVWWRAEASPSCLATTASMATSCGPPMVLLAGPVGQGHQPGSASSSPINLLAYHGYVVFAANDGDHGVELWKSAWHRRWHGDAQGPPRCRQFVPHGHHRAAPARDRLRRQRRHQWYQLQITDLSATKLVMDIYAGAGSSSPYSFLAMVDDRAYFAATHPTSGRRNCGSATEPPAARSW